MRILIVSRAMSYMSNKAYDVPNIFKPALDSLFALKKHEYWTVDIMFLNHYGIYTPKKKGMRFSWIYEAMPTFIREIHTIAERQEYSHVFVVEPDIVLPKDALISLMSTMEEEQKTRIIGKQCAVVVGIYPERPSKVKSFARKGQPINGWLVCMPWNNNPKAEMGIARRQPFIIDGCAGFGCMLIDIRRTKYARFPQRDLHGNGPDFGFYQTIRLGLACQAIADPNVRCGHIENNGTIIRGPL